MTATQAQINGGKVGQASIKYEQYIKRIFCGHFPIDQEDIWDERITRSKTDVATRYLNFSIKNPEKSSTSTQIQVCTVDRFCKLLKPANNIKTMLDQFCGNHGYFKQPTLFEAHCVNVWGIDLKILCNEREIRRGRLLASSIKDSNHLVNWLEANKRKILEFVFKTGFNNPNNAATIASHIIWTKQKNSPEFEVIAIDPLIDSIVENSIVKIRDHKTFGQSVIEIGPVTLQMKGSGKNASAYHNMQFNASLDDLKKYI